MKRARSSEGKSEKKVRSYRPPQLWKCLPGIIGQCSSIDTADIADLKEGDENKYYISQKECENSCALPEDLFVQSLSFLSPKEITDFKASGTRAMGYVPREIVLENFARQDFYQDLKLLPANPKLVSSKICAKIKANRGVMFSGEIFRALKKQLNPVDEKWEGTRPWLVKIIKCILENEAWKISVNERMELFILLMFLGEYKMLQELIDLGLLKNFTHKDAIHTLVQILNGNIYFGPKQEQSIGALIRLLDPKKLSSNEIWDIWFPEFDENDIFDHGELYFQAYQILQHFKLLNNLGLYLDLPEIDGKDTIWESLEELIEYFYKLPEYQSGAKFIVSTQPYFKRQDVKERMAEMIPEL